MPISSVAGIGWVQPAKPIRGLDHLGVQAPCIALYGQLLPGITNVTDRARYYSFYPWLIRAFEQRYHDHSIEEFRRVLRRAECLFALVAIRHARITGDKDEARHGAAMVGRFSLLRIPEGEKAFALAEYAALEGENRYFKNTLGGFGQYYFAPLRDLRVLDYSTDAKGAVPGYDKVRGVELADAFGLGVPEDSFFRLLENERIRWSDLDDLVDFCPCRLGQNKSEQTRLLDLFLAKTQDYREPESQTRRESLALVLDLISKCAPMKDYSLEDVFRGATYGGALPDGTPWKPQPPLIGAKRGWAVYEQNELLSLALQALFAATLRTIQRDRSGRFQNAGAAGDICVSLLPSSEQLRERRIADVVAELRTSLPDLGAWTSDSHEIQRGWRILRAGQRNADPLILVEQGVYLLLSLLARGIDENPYSEFEFEPDHFDSGEIHLLSFHQKWKSIWSDLTIEQWVHWLAVHWGIQRHLNVALRKLRAERRDTFRVRPLEQDLRVVEVPRPVATIPRLERAFQILRDLDLMAPDATGWPTLTDLGRDELEACRGG